ncbi:hypothetical protein [Dysgonomonas sp. 520]|uniref:hypothetical protein n=1 Tax=Dysgonomonas sp. 520 TaxID=2302931 RepID=UPI0013D76A73|nr:hypothetical protein [Dysgonomonas sp. 520]NDW10117.1 hypothetical protein [Dysgonomonas sp. 520]
MDFSFPIESKEGHKYIIHLSEQSLDIFGIPQKEDVCIYNITLALKNGVTKTNNVSTLNRIAKIILDFIDNNNVILYFYCSPSDDIIFNTKKAISPQAYRSRLFTTLFNRISKTGKKDYRHFRFVIETDEDDLYNHFICEKKDIHVIENIENSYLEFKNP